jgi:phosphoribosylaminoimidazole-succinocarboxamide synthase
MSRALVESRLEGLPEPRRGKVRDVYDLGETLLLVATDRLSAYDHVLRPAIPDKGKVLTQLSNFWFEELADVVPNHLLATEVEDFPEAVRRHREQIDGRSVLVRKAEVVPFECVARGYLAGSAYREYVGTGAACSHHLPAGLQRAACLPDPLFTPATKAESGHDENVSFDLMTAQLGSDLATRLRDLTLTLYRRGAAHATRCGLILADTKLEFGRAGGDLLLVDEVLTPDSSRYWNAETWKPGNEPASYDKQYVRNWLDESGWDHESPPPELPEEVVQGTRERYIEAFRKITGREPVL